MTSFRYLFLRVSIMSRSSNSKTHDFIGKVAVVTGAGKGIGRACARSLAAGGASVVAVARTAADLDSLAQEVNEIEEGTLRPWVIDATGPEFVAALGKEPRIDVLVNNVGGNQPEPFIDVTEASLDRLLQLNVRTAFLVAQTVARVMVRQGSGSIIHMSSQMGHVGAVNRTVYCMTKHAIEGLNKAMAVELAPSGVRVNAVAPTFIETPMTRPMFEDPAFKADVLTRIPLGHVGQVDDVADAVCYLAGDRARMVTGTSLKVDGGWTAV